MLVRVADDFSNQSQPPLFSAQPFSVGRFHLWNPHTSRGSRSFCVCHHPVARPLPRAQFAPVPPYLLSKPAPTSSLWHTQAALFVNHLRVCRWEWLARGFARAKHNGKPARPASTSALGRERVVTVAVALTDLAVPPLDEHLALLVDGDVPRTVDRLLLRVMDRGEVVVAFSPHTPLITAVGSPSENQGKLPRPQSVQLQFMRITPSLESAQVDRVFDCIEDNEEAIRTGMNLPIRNGFLSESPSAQTQAQAIALLRRLAENGLLYARLMGRELVSMPRADDQARRTTFCSDSAARPRRRRWATCWRWQWQTCSAPWLTATQRLRRAARAAPRRWRCFKRWSAEARRQCATSLINRGPVCPPALPRRGATRRRPGHPLARQCMRGGGGNQVRQGGGSGRRRRVDRQGQPLSQGALRSRFDTARTLAKVDFQFRDIRAKAATDTGDLAHSQKLLPHKNREMTEHYVKSRVGERARPLR